MTNIGQYFFCFGILVFLPFGFSQKFGYLYIIPDSRDLFRYHSCSLAAAPAAAWKRGCYSSILIGLAVMVYELLYHVLHIWSVYASV